MEASKVTSVLAGVVFEVVQAIPIFDTFALAVPEPLVIEQLSDGFTGAEAIATEYAAPGASDPKVTVPLPLTDTAAALLMLTVRPDPVTPVTFAETEYEVGALGPPPPPPHALKPIAMIARRPPKRLFFGREKKSRYKSLRLCNLSSMTSLPQIFLSR
jgi:hypothetical protein